MQTVESRLHSEMDAIFDFLGAPRSSVQHIAHPSTPRDCVDETGRKERDDRARDNIGDTQLRENVDTNGNLPSFHRTETSTGFVQDGGLAAKTSPSRPKTLDMPDPRPRPVSSDPQTQEDVSDPRQKLLKSQQLIEKHINKLLKEMEHKNGPGPSSH